MGWRRGVVEPIIVWAAGTTTIEMSVSVDGVEGESVRAGEGRTGVGILNVADEGDVEGGD